MMPYGGSSMRPLGHILLSLLVASTASVSPGGSTDNFACAGPPPDSFLTYLDGYYVLDNSENENYPFNSFAISVDKNRTGHLQTYCANSREFPRSPTTNLHLQDNVFVDWNTRISFLDKKRGWVLLTLDEARRLWGSPRVHEGFATFDAKSIWNDEPNIYHLDLKFDQVGGLVAYRVRGIGISNPEWVSKPLRPTS
jgi:hypothetical protein